ncbi:unnamed protein product [Didymodactylos carnosus]|uniref:DOMON domain-containing protein n=1 Tax=Didymodactylos carnosus TaxID=1234261 RepID=A0A8S2F231_9BILA|nr:unnamed protein product [Didymodactylos carnosus]CAF4184165.1 unnamed protein product [Didymodactylos carnosus]
MANVADLWWTVNEASKEITFELHVKTTGWIAIGLALVGGVNQEADMAIGWIDMNGQLHFEDRHAPGFVLPVKDSTTQDWFGLQGREENNWTAIQFKLPKNKNTFIYSLYAGAEVKGMATLSSN